MEYCDEYGEPETAPHFAAPMPESLSFSEFMTANKLRESGNRLYLMGAEAECCVIYHLFADTLDAIHALPEVVK